MVAGPAGLAGAAAGELVVPRGPHPAAVREQAGIGVQQRRVLGVAERPEYVLLGVGGLGQQSQRLVGMVSKKEIELSSI